jgi:hypothetical protein
MCDFHFHCLPQLVPSMAGVVIRDTPSVVHTRP